MSGLKKATCFEILPGDAQIDGVAVTTNYDGRGGDRVLFRRHLEKQFE